jgi:hypothetical protein
MSSEVQKARKRGAWAESRLAKKWGGVRCGKSKAVRLPSGQYIELDVQHPCDVICGKGFFAFESKWLKSAPKSLDKIMTQAIKNCPTGMIPVGVIGDRDARAVYYVMTENDFIDLHRGEVSEPEEEE